MGISWTPTDRRSMIKPGTFLAIPSELAYDLEGTWEIGIRKRHASTVYRGELTTTVPVDSQE